MRFFYPDTPDLPLPAGHRFPAGKYRMLRETLEREGGLDGARLLPSPPIERAGLLLAHDDGYVDRVLDGSDQ